MPRPNPFDQFDPKPADSGPWEAHQRKQKAPNPFDQFDPPEGVAGQWKAASEQQSRQQMSHPAAPVDQPDDIYAKTAKGQSFMENLAAGAGGAAYGIGYLGPKSLMGLDQPGEVEEWKRSMSGLGGTAGGTLGQVAGYGAPVAIAAALAPFFGASVPAAAGLSAAEGFLMPAEHARERAINAVFSAGGGALGQAGGNALAQRASNRLARQMDEASKKRALRSVHDETMRIGRAEGYVLPPSAAGKSSMLETLGGQIKTQQQAAWRNQQVTNRLARRALGLGDTAPLTADTMRGVRAEAGKEYANLGRMGRLIVDRDIHGIKTQVTRKNWFGEVGDNLPQQEYRYLDAAEALERLKQLRHDGHDLLNAARYTGDPGQRAEALKMLGGADAIENAFEENLKARGRHGQLEAFQAARKRIAMSYDIEDAIKSGAGDVEARIIARAYDEGEKRLGPRLTGDLKTIGRFGNAFPQQTAWRSFQPLPNSALDAGAATIAAAASGGNPAIMATAGIPYTRNPIRQWLLRESAQNKLMNQTYAPGRIATAKARALSSPLAKAIEQGAGVYGYGVQPKQ